MGFSERFIGANIVDAGRRSPYWGEHAARYRFSLEKVAQKRVLDIACGTGYGIAMLSEVARSVCGVDVDEEAARSARSECGRDSSVLLGNGLCLPFEAASFDAITSFETIEHIDDRTGFLIELKRVLVPGGLLLLSTPNAHYTLPVDGKPSNPFHIHEYTPEELDEEVRRFFEVEEHLGQSLEIGGRISPFYLDQQRLPRAFGIQAKLFFWRVMNKLPVSLRERLSETLWNRPFYPTEGDYCFSSKHVNKAPVQVVICRKS